MDEKKKSFDFRNKQWQALCEKYEKRGKLNPADCSFSEVNYKLFAKPWFVKSKQKRKKKAVKRVQTESSKIDKSSCNNSTQNETESALDIDISDIIDDDVYETLPKPKNVIDCQVVLTDAFKKNVTKEPKDSSLVKTKLNDNNKFYLSEIHKNNVDNNSSEVVVPNKTKNVKYPKDKENCVAVTQNSLDDLIHFVEVVLESTLKEMITIRSECKILESDEYNIWHSRTKIEMKRLRKYITREELKDYMRHCNREDIDLNTLKDKMAKYGTNVRNNLKDLLIKREFARDDEERYLKYCHKVYLEWQKLVKEIPVDHLILYASGVMNSIREGKAMYTLSDKSQTSVTNGRSKATSIDSLDSGFLSIQS